MKRECFFTANIQTFRSVFISWIFNVALMKIINYCCIHCCFDCLGMERCWLSRKSYFQRHLKWEIWMWRAILMSTIFQNRKTHFKIQNDLIWGGNFVWKWRHGGFDCCLNEFMYVITGYFVMIWRRFNGLSSARINCLLKQ